MRPGWQKWKPTFRVGEVTSLDTDADTANVTLDDALSFDQGFDVNQEATLEDVPVEYMTCNAAAFEIGDRVVVAFTGQDWGSPKIVGFESNPRQCAYIFGMDSTNAYFWVPNSLMQTLIDNRTSLTFMQGGTWPPTNDVTSLPWQERSSTWRKWLYEFSPGLYTSEWEQTKSVFDAGDAPGAINGRFFNSFAAIDGGGGFCPTPDSSHPVGVNSPWYFQILLGGSELVGGVLRYDCSGNGWAGLRLNGDQYAYFVPVGERYSTDLTNTYDETTYWPPP
jgi:hypothetical protein